ncbi:MAG: aminotransferase class III-fold pyridoxal phosphate-dependent enzyme, partial [Thermoguttaceae bacterium]
MKTLEPPIKIRSAQGVHLYTEDGLDLIDSISSWWCVIHGYNHPEINQAITE